MNGMQTHALAHGFAPGKVLLSGEHSVVYGHPSLVCAIKTGSTAYIISKGEVKEEWQVPETLRLFTAQLLEVFLTAFPEVRESAEQIVLHFETSLPVQSGLGSSASLATAGLRALAAWAEVSLSNEMLFSLVMQSEHSVHGNPSGADAAAVIYQGVLCCQKSEGVLERQQLQLSSTVLPSFFLIQSGQPVETTKEMVTYVRTRYDGSSAYREVMREIGQTTVEMRDTLEQEVFSQFLCCVEKNQALLTELGVVSDSTQRLVGQLCDLGAVAKVTGAGGRQAGSGMVLVFHEDPGTLLEFCETGQYEYLETTIEHGR